jgi:hypothetical protein
MKRRLIIGLLFFCSISWGQYQTPDTLWNGSFSGNFLVDSASSGSTSWELIGYTSSLDSNYLVASDLGSIRFNEDTLKIRTINEWKANINNADSLFFQILPADNVYPERITRIGFYVTPASDINDYWKAKYPVSPEEVGVGKTHTDIPTAVTAAGNVDTITVFDGTYDEWTFSKGLCVIGIGFSKIDCGATGDIRTNTTQIRNRSIIGLELTNQSASNYILRHVAAGDGSSYNLYYNSFNADLVMLITDSADFNANNNTFKGLVRMQPNASTYNFNNNVFDDANSASYAQLQIEGSGKYLLNNCYFNLNSTGTGINFLPQNVIDVEFNNCINYGQFINTAATIGGDLLIKNHTHIDAGVTDEWMDIELVDIIIDSSIITGDLIRNDNGKLEIKNTSIINSQIKHINTTLSEFSLINVDYENNDSSIFLFQNSIPIIRGSLFDADTSFRIEFQNSIANANNLIISQNEFNYSNDGPPNNLIYINTVNPFNMVYIDSSIFNMNLNFGIDTSHHTILNFRSPMIYRYNYMSGAIIGHVVKDIDNDGIDNIIFASIFENCVTPIFLRSMPNAKIYNNTIYNNSVLLNNAVFMDDDAGGGVNSDSVTFINNIINSPSGNYYFFGAIADTVGFNSSNNILYNSDSISIAGTNFSFAAWQGLSYDASSTNSNPNFKSSSELWPIQPSDAIGNGINLGLTYQNGLDISSTWPDNVLTTPQLSEWSIGAYVVRQKIHRIEFKSDLR